MVSPQDSEGAPNASFSMHPYHLPDEAESNEAEAKIASYNAEVLAIDEEIEKEKKSMDDALAALNQTFRPSMDAISARIKAFIAEEKAKIGALRSQKNSQEKEIMSSFQTKVAAWERRRALLDKAMETKKGFIAPIRRLPSELLSEVFMWAEMLLNPWDLTKVCKSWRSVALRTPQLWARIAIYESHTRYLQRAMTGPHISRSSSSLFLPHTGLNYEYEDITTAGDRSNHRTSPNQACCTLKGLEKALKLTGSTLLSIIVDAAPSHKNWMIPTVEKTGFDIFKLLIRVFPRCRSLVVTSLPSSSEFKKDLDTALIPSNLSQLRTLEIHPDEYNRNVDSILLLAKRSSLRLERLVVIYPYIMLPAPGEQVPKFEIRQLAQLTYLSIGHCAEMPVEGENEVWSSLTHLKGIKFTRQDLRTWSASFLPALERLSISGGTAGDLGGALNTVKHLSLDNVIFQALNFSISAPVLETLMIAANHIEIAKVIDAPNLDKFLLIQTENQKSLGNEMISNIWNPNQTGEQRRLLNPRVLYIDVEANDGVLVKALKLMDRIETLAIGIREKQNVRKKLFGELSVVPRTTTSTSRGKNKNCLCPNLEELQVFMDVLGSRLQRNGFADKIQLENHLQELRKARPDIDCTMKETGTVYLPAYIKMTEAFLQILT